MIRHHQFENQIIGEIMPLADQLKLKEALGIHEITEFSSQVLAKGGVVAWIQEFAQKGRKAAGIPFQQELRPFVGLITDLGGLQKPVWLTSHFHPENFTDESIKQMLSIIQHELVKIDVSQAEINAEGVKSLKVTVELDFPVKGRCVTRRPGDIALMLRRPPRENSTPVVVRSFQELPTVNTVTFIVNCLKPSGAWILATAYFGSDSPLEPDTFAFDKLPAEKQIAARIFWNTHALALTNEELDQFNKTGLFPA